MAPKLYKAKLPAFEQRKQNYSYVQLIAHAINSFNGQATSREIVTWIQANSKPYKNFPVSSLDMAVSQTLYDHDAYFVTKMIIEGKSKGFWQINGKKWLESVKRNRKPGNKHHKRLVKGKKNK